MKTPVNKLATILFCLFTLPVAYLSEKDALRGISSPKESVILSSSRVRKNTS